MKLSEIQRFVPAGSEVIGSRQLAIPYFKLRLRILIREVTSIPTMAEFLLRSVDAGLSDPEDIRAFLGLDGDLFAEALRMCHAGGLSYLSKKGNQELLTLTNKGRQALEEAVTTETATVQQFIAIDGMTARAFWWDAIKDSLYAPGTLKDRDDVVRVPPAIPTPRIHELQANQSVTDTLAAGVRRKRSEFLGILEVSRATRLYRLDATALAVRPIGKRDPIEWEFVVDGRSSDAHTEAYLRLMRDRQVQVLTVPDAPTVDELIADAFGADGGDQLADERRKASQAFAELGGTKASIHELRRRKVGARPDELPTIDRQLSKTESQLRDLAPVVGEVADLTGRLPVVPINTDEHRPLFRKLVTEAEDRVLIVSPWITTSGLSDETHELLSAALVRGVAVDFVYGISQETEPTPKAKRLLDQLGRHKNFQIHKYGQTHAKVLAVDRRAAIVTSFNWLSFEGAGDRAFRDEQGTLIKVPTLVDGLFEKYLRGRDIRDLGPRSATDLLSVVDDPHEPRAPMPTSQRLAELVQQPESQHLEFKETCRVESRTGERSSAISDEIVKTIAGFLNSDGGTLLIGVSDDSRVVGLDRDLMTFSKKHAREDALENWLTNLVEAKIGKSVLSGVKITMSQLDGRWICAIDVAGPMPDPVFATYGGENDVFFARTNNSTRKYTAREMHEYLRNRAQRDP